METSQAHYDIEARLESMIQEWRRKQAMMKENLNARFTKLVELIRAGETNDEMRDDRPYDAPVTLKIGEETKIGTQGLKKELLKEGEDWKTSKNGDKMDDHSTGTLLDGSRFDSSLDKKQAKRVPVSDCSSPNQVRERRVRLPLCYAGVGRDRSHFSASHGSKPVCLYGGYQWRSAAYFGCWKLQQPWKLLTLVSLISWIFEDKVGYITQGPIPSLPTVSPADALGDKEARLPDFFGDKEAYGGGIVTSQQSSRMATH